MKIKELIADENRWCKGWVARNKQGLPTTLDSGDGVSYCLIGAVYMCYNNGSVYRETKQYNDIQKKLGEYIKDNYGLCISAFNDEYTHDEVLKVVNILDI